MVSPVAGSAIRRALEVLSARPAAIFTDIDGTISHLAPTPDEAKVEQAALDSLQELAAQVDVVGLITGRSAASARAMVQVDPIVIVGNHGFERVVNGDHSIHPAAVTSRSGIEAALEEIRGATAHQPWADRLLFEDKGPSASIHYRHAPEAGPVLEELVAHAGVRHGLRVTAGKMVVELRPGATVNKGTALTDLAHHFGLGSILFLGDDVTDVDGFLALQVMRAEGMQALSVAIVGPDSPPEIAAAADVVLGSVGECVGFLGLLGAHLKVRSS